MVLVLVFILPSPLPFSRYAGYHYYELPLCFYSSVTPFLRESLASVRPVAIPSIVLITPVLGLTLLLLSGTFVMLQQKSSTAFSVSLLIDYPFLFPWLPWVSCYGVTASDCGVSGREFEIRRVTRASECGTRVDQLPRFLESSS